MLNAGNQDLHHNIEVRRVVSPLAIGANATKTGKIIDRLGYNGVEFIAAWGGVVTTGSVATLVAFEGDVTGTMTSVADIDLLGTELAASLTATTPRTSGVSKNFSTKLGYKGSKRYVRVDVVQTGVTSVGCVSVDAVLFNAALLPTNAVAAAQ
jgi:hypothetical protein